jgi:hypothetical protein
MHIKNKLSEDYKLHTREISLNNLYKLLEIEPTPMQLGLITLWDDKLEEFSEVNISASRRQGKTLSGAILAVRELLLVNSSTMVVSKSAKSVGVLFNEILRLLRVLGLKPTKVNSNQYSLQLNDSILRCTVHKTMETLLGNKASLIILDECGTYAYSEDVNINLQPMRNDYGTYKGSNQFVAKILRISSPREIGSDFYYDFIKGLIGKSKKPGGGGDIYISKQGICSLTFSIYDSPLATPELIEALKETTDKETFDTEFLAKFIHMNSISAFNMFNPDVNTFNFKTLSNTVGGSTLESLGFVGDTTSRFKGFLGLDVGYRDNSAIIVATVMDNKIFILDSFAKSYMTSKEFAEEIQKMIDKWTYGKFPLDFGEGANYIDPSAALMGADLSNTYDIPVLPGFNKVRDGISLMNTAFKNRELLINDELTELIDQVSMLAYKEALVGSLNKSAGDPFIRVKGHHFDSVHAMRYLVASLQQYWGIARDEYASPTEAE